jgi:manganese efflux pump family protein
LSFATSIDAAAVGLTFAFLDLAILPHAILIGVVCAICSVFGIFLGDRIGSKIGVWAERFGGIILIIIGFRIFFEKIL